VVALPIALPVVVVVAESVVVVVVVVVVAVMGVVVVVVLVSVPLVVVLVVVVLVVVVQSPPANDAALPSHPRQSRSKVAVASAKMYCPATHGVVGVHSRSACPGVGERLSNSPSPQSECDLQM
jgi:hypothetical protein